MLGMPIYREEPRGVLTHLREATNGEGTLPVMPKWMAIGLVLIASGAFALGILCMIYPR